MAKDAMCPESRWKSNMQDTIQEELKNSCHLSPKPKIDPRKLWICEADEEDEKTLKRRKRRRIPKVPNQNIGARNLLSHMHTAATPICCLRADHGAGRSTFGRHLASSWASKDDDILKLKTFPAVFLISARSIAEVLKSKEVDKSEIGGEICSSGGLLNVYGNMPATRNKVSSTEPTKRQSDARGLDSHIQAALLQEEEFPIIQPNVKMQNGLYALVSSLLPASSAIYGPVAVSNWVLEVGILLIIDDAEDLQQCGLQFLQWVFRHMNGTAATIILMTDPNGFKRITETWSDMKLSRLDLYGLGRDDIVTEAELYIEAKKAEESSKLNGSLSQIEIISKELRSGKNGTVTFTENGDPCPVGTEFKSLNSNAVKGKTSSETIKRKVIPTSTDEIGEASRQNRRSLAKESRCENAAALSDLMTGKRSIRTRDQEKKDDACRRPKEIRDFLSQNMCRLEKVLRFPDTLMQTCDMFADNPDLFDELSTATDLFWTLMHWEVTKAISLDNCRKSENQCSNEEMDHPAESRKLSEYSLEQLDSSKITYKSCLSDSEILRQSLDSLRLSSDLSEVPQELSLPASNNVRNMDRTFHEKMYSWLLLVGEKSLNAFIRNVRMEEDDFDEIKTRTLDMFGASVAESLLLRIFKYKDSSELSNIHANAQTFVEQHALYANHYGDNDLKTDHSDGSGSLLDGCPPNVEVKNKHHLSACTEKLSQQDSFIDCKLDALKIVSTVNEFTDGVNAVISTTENSEFVTEQNNQDTNDNAAKSDQQSSDYPEDNYFNSVGCSLEGYRQINRNYPAVENNEFQDFQDEKKYEDCTESCDFWNESLGNENSTFADNINVNEKNEYLKSRTANIILEKDSVGNDNCKPDDPLKVKCSASHSPCNSPTPTNDTSRKSLEKLAEIPFKKNELESLDDIRRNFSHDSHEHLTDERPGTLNELMDDSEKDVSTLQNLGKTTPAEDFLPKPIEKDEEKLPIVKHLNNSADVDFWSEIFGSGNVELQNGIDVQDNSFLLDKCSETGRLHDENESPEQRKLNHLSKENNSDETTARKGSLSEVTEEVEALFIESLNNEDHVRSFDQKLISQPENENVLSDALRFSDNSKTQQKNDKCFEASGNTPENHNPPNLEEISGSCTISHTQQMQWSFNDNPEEISLFALKCTTDDCLSENFTEKLPAAPCSLENDKGETCYVTSMNGETVRDEQEIDSDFHEKVNYFHPTLIEQQKEYINVFPEEQQGHSLGEDLQEQPKFCYAQSVNEQNEQSEDGHTSTQQQLSPLQLITQQQPQPVKESVKISQENEKKQEQHGNSLEGQLTDAPQRFTAKRGDTRQEQQNQTLITALLQSLRDLASASPSPVLTTKTSLMTQFFASWFLIHEIQSGQSLPSLTCGSGCSLRQLCIFSAGLVNRIRKLVGYNTELNRRRVVCALLNHRPDSSDDLLFNMDLVAEFKAYPDLLSFTVEASEYPDEWHVSLYDVQLVPLQALLLNVAPSRIFLHVEEARHFSEACSVLEFLPRVEILVWMESGRQFEYNRTDRMDKIVESFTVGVVLAKVELVAGCLSRHTLESLPSHPPFKNLVYLKLRVLDICTLSSLLSLHRQLKHLLWVEVRLDFDWLSEEESQINNLPRCSVPLFDVYLRGCADEHVVSVSNLLACMHQRYSGIHLESTSLTPEGVYVLLKQLQQKEIRLYSHPSARQRFRRWYYPQLAEEPAPSDDFTRERLGYDDRVFYSNHCIESNTYASAIDAWNLTSYLEEEERIVHFVYKTENLNFVKRLTGCVDVERINQ